MALKKGLSQNVGVVDVTMVMLAFEAINKVKLEVRLGRVDKGNESDLEIAVLAHEPSLPIGEVPPLASATLTCSAMNLATLDSAVLVALYMLDFQLASGEFEKTISK